MNHRGQTASIAGVLTGLVTAVILLVVVALTLSNSQDILQDQNDDQTAGTFAANSTGSAQAALDTLAQKQGSIATVVAAVVVISILGAGFFGILRLVG